MNLDESSGDQVATHEVNYQIGIDGFLSGGLLVQDDRRRDDRDRDGSSL